MASKSFVAKLFFVLLLLPLAFNANAQSAQKRIALVIGNSEYTQTSRLANPVNDANLMAQTLEKAGFEVTKLLNANKYSMNQAVLKFGRALRTNTQAGLFYYAGHGVQVDGENYLIPVNASITDEDEIGLEGINVNAFLRIMRRSSAKVNIVVLDACRNNPFARSFRSASRGLAPVDAPKGTYIAYSTAPGDVAADGDGKNSPYTRALATAISMPGEVLEDVFKLARTSVLSETNDAQVPWETTSITGKFYFYEPKVTTPKITPPAANFVKERISEAESVYRNIKDSNSISVLKTFSEKFPDSFYATLALAKMAELNRNKSKLEQAKQKSIANPDESNRFAKFREATQKWETLKSSKDLRQLAIFAKDYGDTAFANLAIKKIEYLISKKPKPTTQKKPATLTFLQAQDIWHAGLRTSYDKNKLKDFITIAKNTEFSRRARNRLKLLSTKTDTDNSAANSWEDISHSRDLSTLRRFANKYRGTRYALLAKDRIEDVEAARNELAYSKWNSILRYSDSKTNLQNFARKYSDTIYADLANKRIVGLKPAKPKRTIKKVGGKKRKQLAKVGRWFAFHRDVNVGKTCYVGANPTNNKPTAVEVIFISHWLRHSGDDTFSEPSSAFLDKVMPVKKSTWEIGGVVYDFRIDNEYGFPKNKYQYKEIVKAMKGKRKIIVRTIGKKGRKYTDVYSLNGVTATLKRIDKACPKPL